MNTYLKILSCVVVINAFTPRSGNKNYDNTIVEGVRINTDSLLNKAVTNYKVLIGHSEQTGLFPLSVEPSGELKQVKADHWTSGFFPGTLWYLYEYTNDTFFRQKAAAWTEKIEQEKNNGRTHDIGFMIYCSFGNGYRLTGNKRYLDIILKASETLSRRYSPLTGCIRSWDWGEWEYPVIIDNMMNLEMLFFASNKGKNPYFKEIAVSHAKKHSKTNSAKTTLAGMW